MFHVEHIKPVKMENKYFFENIEPFELNENIFLKINNLLDEENKIKGELSFIFCSDNYLLNMNKKYLKHNYYTDVITFDYCENNIVSGDVFISVDRIKENALTYKSSFDKELQRVMIHGVLHLVGYKDKTETQQKEMRDKENLYLNKKN